MNWWSRLRDRIRGEAAAPSSRRVVLYSRAGCHLCDEAKAVIERHRERFGLHIEEIDIDRDAALKARFDECVPVVEIDGKVRFRGGVNETMLLRLLRRAARENAANRSE